MKIDKRKLIIQILVILGLILSVKLAFIYYHANYDKYALASFCSVNEFIDCDGAAKTNVAQVLGIPLAYWGMLFYLTIFFLTVVDKLKNIKFLNFLNVFKNPLSYITFLGTLSFIISMVLAGVSLYVIRKLCILCVITYVLDFLIAIIAARNIKQYFMSFKDTFVDFLAGIKQYPKTFIILLITVSAFLTYSGMTNVFLPHVKKSKEIRMYANMDVNPYKINGNILGAKNADIVIDLYSDFICPLCYIQNIVLHKAAKEYSNIKVVHHNLPFDRKCNKMMDISVHPGACFMAKAAIAAGLQGNYWGMSSVLYEKSPRNIEKLKPYLKELNLDEERFIKDINSPEVEKTLNNEVDKINNELSLYATPVLFINGEQNVGVMSYTELTKILKKHGAKRAK